MDFSVSEDQRAIRGAVAELAGKFGDEYWAEHDEKHEFPWEFYNAFAEAGWLGIAIVALMAGAYGVYYWLIAIRLL